MRKQKRSLEIYLSSRRNNKRKIYIVILLYFSMEYIPFPVSVEKFLALEEKARDDLTIAYYNTNRNWLNDKLAELNVTYLVVGGASGRIYRYGNLQDFPEEKYLEEILRKTKELPFAWTPDPVVEEVTV